VDKGAVNIAAVATRKAERRAHAVNLTTAR
jgi:hypothetical protein